MHVSISELLLFSRFTHYIITKIRQNVGSFYSSRDLIKGITFGKLLILLKGVVLEKHNQ